MLGFLRQAAEKTTVQILTLGVVTLLGFIFIGSSGPSATAKWIDIQLPVLPNKMAFEGQSGIEDLLGLKLPRNVLLSVNSPNRLFAIKITSSDVERTEEVEVIAPNALAGWAILADGTAIGIDASRSPAVMKIPPIAPGDSVVVYLAVSRTPDSDQIRVLNGKAKLPVYAETIYGTSILNFARFVTHHQLTTNEFAFVVAVLGAMAIFGMVIIVTLLTIEDFTARRSKAKKDRKPVD